VINFNGYVTKGNSRKVTKLVRGV